MNPWRNSRWKSLGNPEISGRFLERIPEGTRRRIPEVITGEVTDGITEAILVEVLVPEM